MIKGLKEKWCGDMSILVKDKKNYPVAELCFIAVLVGTVIGWLIIIN